MLRRNCDTLKSQTRQRRGAEVLRLMLWVTLVSFSISCGSNQGTNNSPNASAKPASAVPGAPGEPMAPKKLFKSGEAVPAGYLGYKVFRAWFSDSVPLNGGKKSTPGNYLTIELAIVNTDKKERAVAPLKLIDETGKEYSLSEKASSMKDGVEQLGKVGPTQSKRAVAVFEAAPGHEYKLKIQGFSTDEEVQIELTPASNEAAASPTN